MVAGLEDGVEEELGNRINLGRQPRLECNVDGIGVQDEVRNFDSYGGPPIRIYSPEEVKAAKLAYPFFPNDLLALYLDASQNHIKNYIGQLQGVSKIDPERQYSLEEAVSFLEPLGLNGQYSHNTEAISGKAIIVYAAKSYFAEHHDVRQQMLARRVLKEEVLLTPQFSNN